MEKCAASLDQLFPEIGADKFNGQVPNDLEILRQIANALAYIHSQNQIHRDIKPPNIFISADGVIKLADFGHAKQTNDNGSISWSGPCGTQFWMSPEMIKFIMEVESAPESISDQWGRISNATDVFSAGLVFFFLFTGGRHPFGAGLLITSNILLGLVSDSPEETEFDGNWYFYSYF